MKFRYINSVPFSLDKGGCKQVTNLTIEEVEKKYEIKPFDFSEETIEYNVLLIFTLNAFLDPGVIEQLKSKGVKIILFPVFDRLKPLWVMKVLSNLYFPVHHEYNIRKKIIDLADLIITFNKTEFEEIEQIYKAKSEKSHVLYLGLNKEFKNKVNEISENQDQPYLLKDIKEFVFLPAAAINTRKNQLTAIRALSGCDIKLVLNNCHRIQDGLEEEFKSLIRENIICLNELTLDELIWCYKNAKVVLSVSNAETAGYTNIEAGYCGANLVVSKLPVFYEYLGKDNVRFVDQNNIAGVREAVVDEFEKNKSDKLVNHINEKFNWENNIEEIIKKIKILTNA